MKPLFSIGPIGLAAVGFLAAVPATALGDTAEGPSLAQRLWLLTGTFHPMVVHFPIALLLVAAMVEVLRFKFKKISPDVVYYCLLIAAIGAIAAAAFGWARATTRREDDLLFNHRWLGVTVAILAVVVAILAVVARRKPHAAALRTAQTVGVLLVAGLVGLVGHLGGELTYGEGFVQDAFAKAFSPPEPVKPVVIPKIQIVDASPAPPAQVDTPQPPAADSPVVADAGPAAKLGGGDPARTVTRVDFLTQIWPIFDTKCVKCHGPTKAKGRLRMDSKVEALKGGKTGPAWIAGKSAESLILKRLVTDPDDPNSIMPPPEEGETVSAEEYELIRRWIDEGAEWPVLPEAPAKVSDATL